MNSKDKEAEALAEEIVFEVMVNSINPSSSSMQTHDKIPETVFKKIHETVFKIVSDLEMNGIKMDAPSRKCIVIAVHYETYDAVLSLLDYMDSELLKEHLEELSTALGQHLGMNIQTTFNISNNDLNYIWQELGMYLLLLLVLRSCCCSSMLCNVKQNRACICLVGKVLVHIHKCLCSL